MSDAESVANNQQKLACRPDLQELLKATATSKAEVIKETARLEREVAALRPAAWVQMRLSSIGLPSLR
jgi:hypothetical protein